MGLRSVAFAILLVAAQPAPAEMAAEEPAAGEPASLEARIAAERGQKEEWFRDHPWSPLRAIARHDFSASHPQAAILGSADDATVRLPGETIAPHHLSIAVLLPDSERSWQFLVENLGPSGTVAINGEPLEQKSNHESALTVPEETLIEIAQYAVRPYVQGDAGILILFDSRRTGPGLFEPPSYFKVDPGYAFRAPLHSLAEPELVPLQTSIGRTKEYRRVGYFELRIGGVDARVYAYQPTFVSGGEDLLSILFSDPTSGKETSDKGRYLDLDPPADDGLYEIDFNRAYNPYCSYTDAYNCPIPPQENRLEVPIRAGEKIYRHESPQSGD